MHPGDSPRNVQHLPTLFSARRAPSTNTRSLPQRIIRPAANEQPHDILQYSTALPCSGLNRRELGCPRDYERLKSFVFSKRDVTSVTLAANLPKEIPNNALCVAVCSSVGRLPPRHNLCVPPSLVAQSHVVS